ncbi:MAG TPA: BamA/TamA family outer membrane protein [Thermomonas sp.]|nr:BamA/TamA family outer membrane protein [Thermomonas sp.]
MLQRSACFLCCLLSAVGAAAPALASDDPQAAAPVKSSEVAAPVESPQVSEPVKSSRLRSPEDGWLDLSLALDQAYGFVPLLVPITEPAVGEGAAGALIFIDKPESDPAGGQGRPNLSVVGALGTNNGTRGLFAADMRNWRNEHVKTLVGAVDASVNLQFYGIGRDPALEHDPRTFNLDTTAGTFQVKRRIGESRSWIGVGYVMASTRIRFERDPPAESLPRLDTDSRVGGLLPTITFDSRDNLFTPSKGNYLDASVGLFTKALGSDDEFQRVNLTAIHYRPLADNVTLGVMGSSTLSFGDTPFYLHPFIVLRGVPLMRYQGEQTAQLEGEVRWQFWRRFSVVGFAGTGRAWRDDRRGSSSTSVNTGGAGFRYELARKYGLHVGIDAAHGPDGMAYYVQFGSAWFRP